MQRLRTDTIRNRFATGLYTNWDSFIDFNDNVLEWLKKADKTRPKGVVLDTIEEAAYILDKAIIEGGKEFLISDRLYLKLKSLFKIKKRELGGNGFHMGRALYELGFNPLVSYPFRPKSIMLASPNFKIAFKKSIKSPKEAIRDSDPEYDHLIFEFKKDLSKGIMNSGRQIFSWDLMSSKGIFDYDFLEIASNSNYTDVLMIGYAHLLLPDYKRKTDEIIEYIKNHKRPKVHFELGRGNEDSVIYAMKKFSDNNCSESWGMNEDECFTYLKAESMNINDLINASLEGIRNYDLKRICVHSQDFAFSISKYDMKKELEALEMGCIASTALTLGSIKDNLDKVNSLPRSNIEPIKKNIDGYNLCLIPTFLNYEPKILTGLGDTFAGVQAAIALS
ncbi:MAG: ADP-dependent glucokinase/phosphofructokinase [Nitrososphaerales archaeon]